MRKIFKPLAIIILIIGLIFLTFMYALPKGKDKKVQEQNFVMNHGNKDWHWIENWEQYNKDHKNFEIYSNNTDIAHVTEKVIHDDGKFELNANSVGQTFLTLVGSTKNSNLEKKWIFPTEIYESVEPEKINIEISNNNSSIETGNTDSSIVIKNYLSLSNLSIESTNKNIATVFNDNEIIHISAIAEGETKIIVNADNAINPVEINVIVNKKLFDIELSNDNINLQTEEINSSISIKNYKSLMNVSVKSKNNNVVQVTNENEIIKVTALAEGETKIIVNADNAKSPIEINVIVNKKLFDIELSNNKISIENGQTNSSIIIKNYKNLENVNVDIKNSKIASVINEGEVVKVTALAEGETKIIVNADNAKNPVEINVTVTKKLFIIELSNNNISIENGQASSSIKIKNYESLNNVSVESKNINVAQVTNENEVIKVTALAEGETKIIVNADNAKNPVEINVIVTKKLFNIELSNNNISVEAEKTDSTISIKNFEDLNNVSFKITNEKNINVTNENEIIKVTGLVEGETKIIVNADNAITPVEINVIVTKKLFNIELSNKEISIEAGQSDSITIENYNSLKNINIESKNSKIALVINESNNIKISAIAEGETKIIVNADNAITPVEINVIVTKKLFNIELSNDNITLESGQTNSSIRINNYDSLVNVGIKSKNNNVAEIKNENGIIKISALAEGETKIIVNADNAKNPVEINVIVTKKLFNIELSNNNISIEAEQNDLITIENFENLINVSIKSNNEDIIGVVHENEKIKIEGLVEGETKIIVNADNAKNPVEINVTITKKLIDIKVNKTKVKIRVGSALTKIKILNYEDLENPEVKNSSSGLITVSVKEDTISIKALLIGDATITVNADNAREIVKIEVKARLI
ncbi:Ig-like domain-containing protein [Spiroplasma cantharicola]|uniref:BIG2 domain-containing protein n=1 Tax=Spiroplasma cantharicola TaxID=362837 RepID=A0A0M4JJM8_9MOLU|nr:hypothetical protein [Spiroplasma cantharicola]ALD66423.1 hypothetical protein SCANT_v1c05170 [Spiroplasma cantharicola]